MLGDVEVDYLSSLVVEHQEDKQDAKRSRAYREEVDRHQVPRVIVEEGLPGLVGWPAASDHVLGDSGLGEFDPEHPELAVDAGCAPEGILSREPVNKAATTAGSPSPIPPESLPVPAHQGVRLDEGEGINTAGPNAVEPDPEKALVMPDARSSAVLRSERCQLLTRREDLEVEQGAASEQAGEGSEQGEQYGLHRPNAIAPDQEPSTTSLSTRSVVGTGRDYRTVTIGLSVYAKFAEHGSDS